MVDQLAYKLPGDMGEKAKDLADKADELTDQIPGGEDATGDAQ
jgi:hypothetical protein